VKASRQLAIADRQSTGAQTIGGNVRMRNNQAVRVKPDAAPLILALVQ
jgi:hypothetical protein